MNFENIRLLYVFSCIGLGLLILLPTFFAVFPFPEGEGFSELWLLGSNHMIESGRLDVLLNTRYSVYLGVHNQMPGLEYYRIYVKLLSKSEAFQETGTGIPISLEPIFEYRFVLSSNETWEENFAFIFKDVTFEENLSRISNLSINGNDINVDKILIQDNNSNEFYCQMVFELWIYNSTTSVFQFHNHFVEFWMNMEKQM